MQCFIQLGGGHHVHWMDWFFDFITDMQASAWSRVSCILYNFSSCQTNACYFDKQADDIYFPIDRSRALSQLIKSNFFCIIVVTAFTIRAELIPRVDMRRLTVAVPLQKVNMISYVNLLPSFPIPARRVLGRPRNHWSNNAVSICSQQRKADERVETYKSDFMSHHKRNRKLTQCPKNNNHIYPILLHETFLRDGCYWFAFRRKRRWDPQFRSTDTDV